MTQTLEMSNVTCCTCADRAAKSSCINACQVKFTITLDKATRCPTEIALQGSACPSTASGMCTNLTLCLMSHVSVLLPATADGAIDHNMMFALECSVAVHRKRCQSLGVCVLVCELCTMLLWFVATKSCSDTIGKAILKASLPRVYHAATLRSYPASRSETSGSNVATLVELCCCT